MKGSLLETQSQPSPSPLHAEASPSVSSNNLAPAALSRDGTATHTAVLPYADPAMRPQTPPHPLAKLSYWNAAFEMSKSGSRRCRSSSRLAPRSAWSQVPNQRDRHLQCRHFRLTHALNQAATLSCGATGLARNGSGRGKLHPIIRYDAVLTTLPNRADALRFESRHVRKENLREIPAIGPVISILPSEDTVAPADCSRTAAFRRDRPFALVPRDRYQPPRAAESSSTAPAPGESHPPADTASAVQIAAAFGWQSAMRTAGLKGGRNMVPTEEISRSVQLRQRGEPVDRGCACPDPSHPELCIALGANGD